MTDVKWIKITTNIFDDEKILLIESMPDADSIIVVWFKLLTLAGKQNNSGVFVMNDRIAYTDEMLATIFRRPLTTVRLALDTFEQFGMVEIINNIITIPNWEKHQSLDKIELKKAYDREYQAKKREIKRVSIENRKKSYDNRTSIETMSNDNRTLDKDKEKDKDIKRNIKEKDDILNSNFEEFWKLYPRCEGKVQAKKAYEKALKKTNKDEILTALKKRIEMDWSKKTKEEKKLLIFQLPILLRGKL